MRWSLAFAITLLAGCTSSPQDGPHEQEAVPLPQDFEVEGAVPPTLAVYGTTEDPCEILPPTECQRFPFNVPRTATVTALLEWDATIEDVDLYLFQNTSLVGQSERRYGPEFIRLALEPGDYEFAVRGGSETAGTAFILRVWFDEPRTASPNP
jgi:hypothetical protein